MSVHRDPTVVLIRNERFAIGQTLWELPAGMMDGGETPEQSAARELIEEAGYRAGRLEKLGEIFTAPGPVDERMHVFRATGLTQVGQALEGYEQIDVHPTEPAQVQRMVADNTIRDAKTMAVLLMHRLGASSAGSGGAQM